MLLLRRMLSTENFYIVYIAFCCGDADLDLTRLNSFYHLKIRDNAKQVAYFRSSIKIITDQYLAMVKILFIFDNESFLNDIALVYKTT